MITRGRKISKNIDIKAVKKWRLEFLLYFLICMGVTIFYNNSL